MSAAAIDIITGYLDRWAAEGRGQAQLFEHSEGFRLYAEDGELLDDANNLGDLLQFVIAIDDYLQAPAINQASPTLIRRGADVLKIRQSSGGVTGLWSLYAA